MVHFIKQDDTITVTGGGTGALFQIEDIGTGSVEEIIIDNAGIRLFYW